MGDQPDLAFLDSAAEGDARSCFSYICFAPFSTLRLQDGCLTIDGIARAGDPFEHLKHLLALHHRPPGPLTLPFTGGAVGFFSFDAGRALEDLPSRHPATGTPDIAINFYKQLIGFDHATKCCWLMSGTEADAASLKVLLARPFHARKRPPLHWEADFYRRDYEAGITRLLDYIRAGDIFQANYTQSHTARHAADNDLVALYLALRVAAPAPFAAYFSAIPAISLLSASPERFISLDVHGGIEARPIKGTRPRHPDPAQDEGLACELRDSAKDRAENLMIVDLMRSDIGRVAAIGSVAVPSLCAVESFATVHHLVSSVTARLRPGLGAVDLLRATLPAGSVTGAPKRRALQIIDELETSRRGAYCGVMAWIGFDGAMDSSVLIRTIIATPGLLRVQSGGGIVADSIAATEYEELMLKAKPFLDLNGG